MAEEEKTADTSEKSIEKEQAESSGEKAALESTEKQLDGLKVDDSTEQNENAERNAVADEENGDEKEISGDGDGQDLDDDEQEENPAYIPKKGRYYMHDSRDEAGVEDFQSKKSRADGAWSHDRYVERWQQPKSRKQLVATYGFNIRFGETEEEATENEKNTPAENSSGSDQKSSQRGRGRERGSRSFRGRGGRGTGRSHLSNDEDQGSTEEDQEHNQEESRERGGTRRQRPAKTAVVRNVRGGRGQTSHNGRGNYRTQERTRNNDAKETKEEHTGQEKNIPSQRRNDDYMENHRRGATRGAVRGFPAQGSRQFVRTVSSSTRNDRGGRYPAPRNEEHNGRTTSNTDGRPSGGYAGRARGSRGAMRGTPRAGTEAYRGNSGPKRYETQRQDGQPQGLASSRGYTPRQDVVFFEHPTASPNHQHSPVVYFDPAAQQQNRSLPPREKKIIEIKSPN